MSLTFVASPLQDILGSGAWHDTWYMRYGFMDNMAYSIYIWDQGLLWYQLKVQKILRSPWSDIDWTIKNSCTCNPTYLTWNWYHTFKISLDWSRKLYLRTGMLTRTPLDILSYSQSARLVGKWFLTFDLSFNSFLLPLELGVFSFIYVCSAKSYRRIYIRLQ